MKEIKYYGVHACLRLFKERPKDIIRVYIEQDFVQMFSSMLKWCAQHKKAYKIVDRVDLERLTESIHHEGVCVLAKEKPALVFESWLAKQKAQKTPTTHMCCVYLDGVQDPHNVGAILRTCAHFGVRYVLGDAKLLPKLSPAAYRIGKGAGDVVELVPLTNPIRDLELLKKAGFVFLAASHKTKNSLYATSFGSKVVIGFGAEDVGIRLSILGIANGAFSIPGSGLMESINVATATGVVLGEWWRQSNANPNQQH